MQEVKRRYDVQDESQADFAWDDILYARFCAGSGRVCLQRFQKGDFWCIFKEVELMLVLFQKGFTCKTRPHIRVTESQVLKMSELLLKAHVRLQTEFPLPFGPARGQFSSFS